MEEESWRAVVGFEGLYEVSDLGRVRSLERVISTRGAGTRVLSGKVLAPKVGPKGYCRVGLYAGGRQRFLQVHRLVAAAFIGPAPEFEWQVNHRDLVKSNNRPNNLEYCTGLRNMQHAREGGLFDPYRCGRVRKLTPECVARIRSEYATGLFKQSEIAEKFGVRQAQISSITLNKSWVITI